MAMIGRTVSRGDIPGQEVLSFDGPLTINTADYDLEQAREAAQHRKKRKGELALNPRTTGFNRRVKGLWVPHSGTENSAVVAIPENYVQASRRLIRDKVIEKYEGSDVSPQRVLLWAYFAGHQAGKEVRQKFNSLIIDSREGYLRIHAGLGENGEIDRERIEETGVAHRGVMRYLVHLRAFVGAQDMLGKGERRKWPQERHRHVMARHMGWAASYLDVLNTEEFGKTVQEAYYSERSRNEFWTHVRNEHMEFLKVQNRVPVHVPIEVYAADPRANEYNYVDDEYIG